MISLKPCPFCGDASPVITQNVDAELYILCETCGARSGITLSWLAARSLTLDEYSTKTAEKWNRRALTDNVAIIKPGTPHFCKCGGCFVYVKNGIVHCSTCSVERPDIKPPKNTTEVQR